MKMIAVAITIRRMRAIGTTTPRMIERLVPALFDSAEGEEGREKEGGREGKRERERRMEGRREGE